LYESYHAAHGRTRLSTAHVVGVLVLIGGALCIADPLRAQDPIRQHQPASAWTADIGVGVLAQPARGTGAGPALSATVGRHVAGSRVRISGIVIGSHIEDVGAPGPDRYVFDRDWVITALGAEAPVLATPRLELAIAGRIGALLSRDRRVGSVGTPVPPGFPEPSSGSGWDAGVALLPDLSLSYRVARSVAVTSRVAAVQHVFTDDMFGATGALVSLGAAFSW